MAEAPVIEVKGITKRFKGLTADRLRNVFLQNFYKNT